MIIGLAAAIALIIGIILLKPSNDTKAVIAGYSAPALVNNYFPELDNLTLGLGGNERDSIQFYLKKITEDNPVKWNEALDYFSTSSVDSAQAEKFSYYVGLIYLKQQKYQEAYAAFQRVLDQHGDRPETKAYWAASFYQIIVLVGLEKTSEAMAAAKTIADYPPHPFGARCTKNT